MNEFGPFEHPEWRAVYDKSSQQSYFVNVKSQETTWTRPAALQNCAIAPVPSSIYEQVEDSESGAWVYLNLLTGETVDVMPEFFDVAGLVLPDAAVAQGGGQRRPNLSTADAASKIQGLFRLVCN